MLFSWVLLLSSRFILHIRAFILPVSYIIRVRPSVGTRLLSDDGMDIIEKGTRRIAVKTYEELSENTRTMGLSGGIQVPVVVPKNATTKPTRNTFGITSAEEFLSSENKKHSSNATDVLIAKRKPDLNGIEPWTPFVYAFAATLLSAGGWQVCSYLAKHFATSLVDSPTYQLQRAAIIARNLVVGMTALFTGFSGVIAVGLVLLGAAVTIGVLKGDLNPNDTNS